MAAVRNRDLARPWIILEFGAQDKYPRIRIGRQDQKDIASTALALTQLVPLGLKVQMSEARDMLGFADPDPDAELLSAPAAPAPVNPTILTPAMQAAIARRLEAPSGPAKPDAVDAAIDAMLAQEGWEPLIGPMIADLDQKLAKAVSIEEATQILALQLQGMDMSALAEKLARAGFAARIAGVAQEPLSTEE
ncbi:MAG TPA: DUF935 family protein [Stellaceae bacterium]